MNPSTSATPFKYLIGILTPVLFHLDRLAVIWNASKMLLAADFSVGKLLEQRTEKGRNRDHLISNHKQTTNFSY